MNYNPQAAVSTAKGKSVLLLSAILPVFYLRFVPYEKLLVITGIAAVATGIFVIIKAEHSASANNLFVSALAFFLMAIICKRHPAIMAAGVGMWIWRKSALLPSTRTGRFSTFPFVAVVRLIAGFCAAVALILWGGTYDFTTAFFASAIMAAVAVLADAGLNPKNRAPLAELVATLSAVSILGFHIANLLYMQSLWFAMLVSLIAAVFFYRIGLLEKTALSFFFACAVVIFISLGWPGWILYFVSLLICEAGWRSCKQNGAVNPLRIPHKFAAHSFPPALLAILSAGWDTPFIFYFAFAGALSALAFQNLYCPTAYVAPDKSSHHKNVASRRNLSSGIIGITVISACAVSSKFISMGGLFILLLAGISPLLAPAFRNVLAKPGRDAAWLTPLLGAAVAAVSTKLL